jgi:MFS family permease
MSLERAAGPPPGPTAKPVATAIALLAGVTGLIVGAILQFGAGQAITTMPDPRVTVPLAAVAGLALVVAWVRRERGRALAVIGLGAGVCAVVLGYVVVVSLVAIAAVIVCAIAAKFF